MKLLKPTVRAFFKFMNERQRIYLSRERGDAWPWTKDKILREWKFTNVYRQQDRVTVELGKRLKMLKPKLPENILFHICVFRMYNWPPTYDALLRAQNNVFWNKAQANWILKKRKSEGDKIFTGAYMMTGSGAEGRSKHELANESLTQIWRQRAALADRIRKNQRLSTTTRAFTDFPMISNFVGYEIACDLRWTKVLRNAHDTYTWANPGPGAQRGLSRLISGEIGMKFTEQEAVIWMRELLAKSPLYLEPHMDQLEMRDVEHTLCEFDKYERFRRGEGRPRSRYQPPPGVINA